MPTKTQQAVLRAPTTKEKFLGYLQDASEWLTRPIAGAPNPVGLLASQLGRLDPTTLLDELRQSGTQDRAMARITALPPAQRRQAFFDAATAGEIPVTASTVPFESFAPKLRSVAGKPTIFHGTKEAWERIDPTKHNVGDTLGWMFHAAESPAYADDYAFRLAHIFTGHIKPVTSSAQRILDLTQPLSPKDAELVAEAARIAGRKYNYSGNFHEPRGLNPGKIDPALFDSQNILNFQAYKQYLEELDTLKELVARRLSVDKESLWAQRIIDELSDKVAKMRKHQPESLLDYAPTHHSFETKLRAPFNDPTITKQLGVQGIRYTDVDKPVFAFSDMSTLSSPFGATIAPDISKQAYARWLANQRLIYKLKKPVKVPDDIVVPDDIG